MLDNSISQSLIASVAQVSSCEPTARSVGTEMPGLVVTTERDSWPNVVVTEGRIRYLGSAL